MGVFPGVPRPADGFGDLNRSSSRSGCRAPSYDGASTGCPGGDPTCRAHGEVRVDLRTRLRRTLGRMPGQWHLDADAYLEMVRSEVAGYDAFQDRIAGATADLAVDAILDLGSGTGVTASRVLAHHPAANLVGVDSSPEMLEHARRAVPAATFIEARLEDALPEGPFDLVVSAFAIHHLSGHEKARLFQRIREVLRPAGRLVFCDVVVPERPVAMPIPLEVGVDFPDTVRDQLDWLVDAGFDASVVLADGDVAILQADRR